MRILKLFKKHVLALFAAIVLIVISCNADLALPTYMSDIVDVGVQQGGIASPVPDTIRAESLDDLELFMSAKDAKAVEAVFSKADKNDIRTYEGTEEDPSRWHWFEGNFEGYEENKIERLGPDAAKPSRMTYRKLTRD